MFGNDYDLKDELISNPTPRVPVCLCLDISYSMYGAPINELNRGVQQFIFSLMQDEVARYSAEICTVTFGGQVQCVQDFGDLEHHHFTPLSPCGDTPMGEALTMALDKLEERKQQYKKVGIEYHQPWLVLMTDGYPNGAPHVLQQAAARTAQMQQNNKLTIFPIAIGDQADRNILRTISPLRQPLKLKGLNFVEFFQWLSRSIVTVSQSQPRSAYEIKLAPSAIKDWATL